MRGKLLANARKPLIHRPRIRIEIDEEKATEIFGRHACQAYVITPKPFDDLHVRRTAQPPVKLICPGVVRTGDHPRIAASLDKLMRTVLADVIEGADLAIPTHDAKKRLASHIENKIVAGLLQLRGVSGKLPACRQQAAGLDLEYRRVGIVAGVERQDRTGIVGHRF